MDTLNYSVSFDEITRPDCGTAERQVYRETGTTLDDMELVAVTRGPGAGFKPGGAGIAALALDPRGRVYAVAAGACVAPGTVHILSGPPNYHPLGTVTVGVCPAAAALAFRAGVP